MEGAVEDEIKESAEISVINSELDSKDGELFYLTGVIQNSIVKNQLK